MANLKEQKTEADIRMTSILRGKSQQDKYTYYASKAKKDGYVQIITFEETANNEKEHAKIWLKLLHDGMPRTVENLKDAA